MNVFVLLLVVLGEGRIAVCLQRTITQIAGSLCAGRAFVLSCVRAEPAAVNGNNG